jgi:hypothetical protein
MSVKLNRRGYEHARTLVRQGKVVLDERDDWSEHQPSTQAQNDYIDAHGYDAYGLWHLGVDDTKARDTKARYRFPYGDFADVHRCAVLSAESRAGQYKHREIQSAAAHLHGMIETAAPSSSSGRRS